jgi:hypothetical protein
MPPAHAMRAAKRHFANAGKLVPEMQKKAEKANEVTGVAHFNPAMLVAGKKLSRWRLIGETAPIAKNAVPSQVKTERMPAEQLEKIQKSFKFEKTALETLQFVKENAPNLDGRDCREILELAFGSEWRSVREQAVSAIPLVAGEERAALIMQALVLKERSLAHEAARMIELVPENEAAPLRLRARARLAVEAGKLANIVIKDTGKALFGWLAFPFKLAKKAYCRVNDDMDDQAITGWQFGTAYGLIFILTDVLYSIAFYSAEKGEAIVEGMALGLLVSLTTVPQVILGALLEALEMNPAAIFAGLFSFIGGAVSAPFKFAIDLLKLSYRIYKDWEEAGKY